MSGREPLAAIFGVAGPVLTDAERGFFNDADPLGFILFKRNCESPPQVRQLIIELRDSVGRGSAPVLIDQEGGHVARLGPPHWRSYPAARDIAALGGARAEEAARLGARLIADDLVWLGITVDCMPVLDVPAPGSDPVIGDRAYGDSSTSVVQLGREVCDGLLEGGVLPVLKHIPGHGRATVDSHLALPRVTADLATLELSDFLPFRALNWMPWAMTAHILYTAIDENLPATLSPRLIGEVIRGTIGFDGLLLSDDLSMGALPGDLGARAAGALAAGCDVVLHCNGDGAEMMAVARSSRPLSAEAQRRVEAGDACRRESAVPFDRRRAEARFAALLAGEG
ncbi:MAG TPA: glycoside hydrolase family 3 protein [Stellaceae bacterium]|nr:glycoside hydrolase family 3 protein [Stellaceae bacterium]